MGIGKLIRQCWRQPLLWLCCLQVAFATPSASAAEDRGLIYRAGNIYLLGSVHMGKSDFYPLRTAITEAFGQAGALVVEVDLNAVDQQRLQAWIAAHGVYPAGESLRDHVQPATWQRLSAYLSKHRVDVALIAAQKPGLAIATLSQLQMQDIGFSSQLGIDEYFLQQARAQRKPVQELETLEQQLTLLSEFPNPDLVINQTLDEADQLPEVMDAMIAAWKAGDSRGLEKLLQEDMNQNPEYQPLFDKLYTQRNIAMTARIKTLLQSGKCYFVVVGAAHLLGRDGIVEKLRASGIEVRQL